jgi:hypothetical protein
MTNAVSIAQLGANNSSFTNRIINGAMVIDQRNAGASVTVSSDVYTLDRWQALQSQASKYTVQQNAASVTPPTGFINYLGATSSAATSLGASDYFFLQQIIEGLNIADLAWGTANASTVTLSFWVRSSLTGTFGGSLANSSGNRSYPYTFSISSANTWEQKSITVAGDTSGTWLTTNGSGIKLRFGLGVGTTYSGTANAWAGANYFSATGATSVVGTNGATLYITGVQLEKGSTATSFDYRPYGTELQLCQRYFEKSYNIGTVPGTNTTTGIAGYIVMANTTTSLANNGTNAVVFKVYKRTTPTITTYDSVGNSGKLSYAPAGIGRQDNITSVVHRQAEGGFGVYTTSASSLTTGQAVEQFHQWTADAEL